MEKPNITPQVGETAGKVWELLAAEGPQTVAQIKKKIKDSNELLPFALGWLAREDKVEIRPDKKTYQVQLK